MTIKVKVCNEEGADGRTIKVEILTFDKVKGTSSKELVGNLGPGEARTYYIYMLRDLIISEIEPPTHV